MRAFLIAAALTVFYPSSILLTPAQTSTQRKVNLNIVKDKRGNVIAINNLTIDNQRYNAKFIYGTFGEIFKNPSTPMWQNEQIALRALLSINTALNARKPVTTFRGVMPTNQSSFAGSGNNFMIPVAQARVVRQYGKERTENVYVNGVLGGFDEKQKTWSNYSFDAFSLTPDTPFMFVKLEAR
ncbi:hypothetical protein NIES4071_80700 [Calothrix sp. NIES-4071]|nr:hypothetical protein NIES4071_80700 [Calothrix sp. NIES-4071]BAZ62340.1 hypothetical protein NIES4105_80630 [Calothrix sp. NIES-4105]